MFGGGFFNEFVIRLPRSAESVVDDLLQQGIHAGLPLGDYFPDMQNALLVCATEKRTPAEIENYARALGALLDDAA